MPNPNPLNGLYAAAGKAKKHMPSLKSMELILKVDFGRHRFIYYFDQGRKRNMIALESSMPFGFSKEVAEAWGFSLPEGETPKEEDMFITEVIVM